MKDDESEPARAQANPEAVLRDHLGPHEQVLWIGRPIPRYAAWAGFPGDTWLSRGGLLVLGAVGLTPISLGGVYLAWVGADAFFSFASIAAMLVSPVLFAVGLTLALAPWYVLFRPRLRNASNARDAWYVVTGERALVLLIRDGDVVDEQVTMLDGITAPRLLFERGDGAGDVIDAQPRATLMQGEDGSSWTSPGDIGFIGVPDARAVFGILEHAIAQSRARAEFDQSR